MYYILPVLVFFGAGEALVGCVEVAVGFEVAVVAFDVCSGPALVVGLLVVEAASVLPDHSYCESHDD